MFFNGTNMRSLGLDAAEKAAAAFGSLAPAGTVSPPEVSGTAVVKSTTKYVPTFDFLELLDTKRLIRSIRPQESDSVGLCTKIFNMFWDGKTCLVIGGSGNLGSAIVRLLCSRGATVRVFDVVAYKGPECVTFRKGDVRIQSDLMPSVEGCDIVFHTASIIDIRPIPSPNMFDVNVNGTANIIHCCTTAGVQRLVYTSSIEVVSGGQDIVDGNEKMEVPLHHPLPYAATKSKAEASILAANSAHMFTCALRPGYIIGEGCIGLAIEMSKCIKQRDTYITAKLPTKISCVNVENCAQGHLLAAEKLDNVDVKGNAFFIRDFEANVTELSSECLAAAGIKTLMLPLTLAAAMAHVLDFANKLIFYVSKWCFRRHFEISKEVVSVAALSMAYRNLCFSGAKAASVLGYQNSAFPLAAGPGLSLFTQADTMATTKRWVERIYAGLRDERDGNKRA
eukprot:gene6384-7648_t